MSFETVEMSFLEVQMSFVTFQKIPRTNQNPEEWIDVEAFAP
jgi:hypothetical protein|tara:strand:+ start:700 stop:825 length:126 start_codon:yes stop_codon:yes gene_type:complete